MRSALVPAVLIALAGCGGSTDAPDERPAPDRRVAFDELRSPDARSPFVPARAAAWRCATDGRMQLAISAEGEATLSILGRVLASVAPSRALVNRACRRGRGGHGREPAEARGGRLGASIVRCPSPGTVLVDFRRGELTVRAAGDGRFLAGAALRPDRIGVAGYWGAGCAPV